jgi:hypothetical protein
MASEADLKMEISISRMLRAGVSVAGFVVLVGWILYLWQAHGVEPDYRHFHGVLSPADRFGRSSKAFVTSTVAASYDWVFCC